MGKMLDRQHMCSAIDRHRALVTRASEMLAARGPHPGAWPRLEEGHGSLEYRLARDAAIALYVAEHPELSLATVAERFGLSRGAVERVVSQSFR